VAGFCLLGPAAAVSRIRAAVSSRKKDQMASIIKITILIQSTSYI